MVLILFSQASASINGLSLIVLIVNHKPKSNNMKAGNHIPIKGEIIKSLAVFSKIIVII